jgi:imidazolonepropionase-like amidohydrolase
MIAPPLEVGDAASGAAAAKKTLYAGGGRRQGPSPAPPHPGLSMQAVAAAVAKAHGRGKPVFLHPDIGADILPAVRAGVDVVAHTTPRSGAWDDATVAAMIEHRVALTPRSGSGRTSCATTASRPRTRLGGPRPRNCALS